MSSAWNMGHSTDSNGTYTQFQETSTVPQTQSMSPLTVNITITNTSTSSTIACMYLPIVQSIYSVDADN